MPHRRMAENMAADATHKLHSQAVEMVAVINDPIVMAKRLALLQERLDRENAKDLQRLRIFSPFAGFKHLNPHTSQRLWHMQANGALTRLPACAMK